MNKEITDGNLLRHLMWKHDVTVADLAAKAGVSTQTVKNFWRDRVTISVERDLWVAMYCLRGHDIGFENFNSYLEQYYAKKQLDVITSCHTMLGISEGGTWS